MHHNCSSFQLTSKARVNPRFSRPNPGFACPNPGSEQPNPRFQTGTSRNQKFHQPVLDTAAFPQEIQVSDQTNTFLISRTECTLDGIIRRVPSDRACEVTALFLKSVTPFQFTDPSRTSRTRGLEAAGINSRPQGSKLQGSKLQGSRILSYLGGGTWGLKFGEDRRCPEMSGKPPANQPAPGDTSHQTPTPTRHNWPPKRGGQRREGKERSRVRVEWESEKENE